MALDAIFLNRIAKEMEENSLDGRVEKITMHTREDMVLVIRGRNGSKRLLISASALPRICYTEKKFENPKTPLMLCILLRKYLQGARVIEIKKQVCERVITLVFSATDEIGDAYTVSLVAELTGRNSNIMLISGEGKIIDATRRQAIDGENSRIILPGALYSPLSPQEGKVPFSSGGEEVYNIIAKKEFRSLSKALSETVYGVSAAILRKISEIAFGDDIPSSELIKEVFIKGYEEVRDEAISGNSCYIIKNDDSYSDFLVVKPYESSYIEFDSPSVLLNEFYTEKEMQAYKRNIGGELLKRVRNLKKRAENRISAQNKELYISREREKIKERADLLAANLYLLKRGMDRAVVYDYINEKEIEVPLDPRKSPGENVSVLYEKYKKMVTAEQMLTLRIEKGYKELEYLNSVIDIIERAQSSEELSDIKAELMREGFIRASKNDKKTRESSKPIMLKSSDGFDILVGKNNRQNDIITLKTARAHDIWFHVKDAPGSHVVLIVEGEEPPNKSLEEAAIAAAYYSSQSKNAKAAVDLTKIKYVKKPAGAMPGKVIYTDQRTVFVNPQDYEGIFGSSAK